MSASQQLVGFLNGDRLPGSIFSDQNRELAAGLRKEIKDELAGLISPKRIKKRRITEGLERLLERLNGAHLTPHWAISAGQPPWQIRPAFNDSKTLEKLIYGLVLRTWSDGSLLRLKQCPLDSRIFILTPKKRKFCGARCATKFHNKNQPARRKQARKNAQRFAKKQAEKQLVLAPIKLFEWFLDAADGPDAGRGEVWLGIFRKIPAASNTDRWTMIRGWVSFKKQGTPIEAIWSEFTQMIRGIFEKTSIGISKIPPP